jgi:hypothetical protein
MKPIKNLILIIAVFLLYLSGYTQSSDYLKYTYDAAGNRVKREIISLNKSMTVSDTTHQIPNRNDSTQQAATQTALADASHATDATANDANANPNGGNQSAGNTAYSYTQGEQKVLVFPNPTAGQLQIKITPFTLAENGEIQLYDLQGKLLIKTSCTAEITTLDLSRFASGSYILKIRNGELKKEWEVVKE